MLIRILKKDLAKRRGVNLLLFVFITLATVFLASSVNNILVVTSAVDYYMDYAQVPDLNIITTGENEKERVDAWMTSNSLVEKYEYNRFLMLPEKSVMLKKGQTEEKLVTEGASLYVATQDTNYNKVFDENGHEFTLSEGEIAIPFSMREKSKIKEGDKVVFRFGDYKKELTVVSVMKDAAYGSEVVGMNRMMVSNSDFKKFSTKMHALGIYYVMTEDHEKLTEELNAQGFESVTNSISRDTYKMVYSFDMIMAALLILIGVCLILIAFLVLRFTLIFTMEEDYQEIGIMKAVGFRGFAIKKIYLVKYLAIVLAGSVLGLLLSFPVSSTMVAGVSKNMIMENSSANFISNFIAALAVVVLVMAFCYFSTRKLDKVSAITAIRGGQTGERFTKRRGIALNARNRMPVSVFLGIQDLLSHPGRYLVLVITFCISFILITIPLNTINTMHSDEMASKFLMDPESTLCVRKIEAEDEEKYRTAEELEKGMTRLEGELKDKGYDASLGGMAIYYFNFSSSGEKKASNIMAVQAVGMEHSPGDYMEGGEPMLENEIAFSKKIMDENDWVIGDSVESLINGTKKTFVITGIYSDYMKLGYSARINPVFDLRKNVFFDYWNLFVYLKGDMGSQEALEKFEKEFPDYKWITVQSAVNQQVGGIRESLKEMLLPMTAMLCGLIMLITILMEKLFIVREKGEIAMMKSIGFRNRSIRSWQIVRMVCVVIMSMAAAVPLSVVSNRFMLKPIFSIMGAEVEIQVVPWQVYGVYPGILFTAIMFAALFATKRVRKINIQALNNLE